MFIDKKKFNEKNGGNVVGTPFAVHRFTPIILHFYYKLELLVVICKTSVAFHVILANESFIPSVGC